MRDYIFLKSIVNCNKLTTSIKSNFNTILIQLLVTVFIFLIRTEFYILINYNKIYTYISSNISKYINIFS